MILAGVAFLLSLATSLILVRLVRALSLRSGAVAKPREDRWHTRPTPALGGIGIFLSFVLSLSLLLLWRKDIDWSRWGLLVGSATMFLLGLYDDLRKISPPAKLIGQILAAALVIFLGYQTNFFTPKIANPVLAQIPNLLLTFLWLVGITNAINLLDNIDGLAAGISVITVVVLGYFFAASIDLSLLVLAAALAGSLLGFLAYNFPPASIFMGDSGSLFLGFTLAALAIARRPQASNVFAVLGVPTLLFLLPILDTFLVTITRVLRGQSPVQGGRDHTSHRLIAFGLTERQTLFVLYAAAILAGLAAIGIETIDYWLSLILVPLLVISLTLAVAYLGRLRVVASGVPAKSGAFSRLMVELTYRRRILEIILDFFLFSFSFYLTSLVVFGFALPEQQFLLFLRSLPLVYVGCYISCFYFGVYRGVWRYVGMDDLLRYGKAAFGSGLLIFLMVFLVYDEPGYPGWAFLLFGVVLFLCLAASRSSFRLLDLVFGRQTRLPEQRVLILGAGDDGEMAVRWIMMQSELGYHPVGFIDQDPYNYGRQIHGVTVLGSLDRLEEVIEGRKVEGVILTREYLQDATLVQNIKDICRAHGCWIRALRLEFETMEL